MDAELTTAIICAASENVTWTQQISKADRIIDTGDAFHISDTNMYSQSPKVFINISKSKRLKNSPLALSEAAIKPQLDCNAHLIKRKQLTDSNSAVLSPISELSFNLSDTSLSCNSDKKSRDSNNSQQINEDSPGQNCQTTPISVRRREIASSVKATGK